VDTGTILVRSPAPPGQLGVGSVQLGSGGTPALSDGLQLGAVCGRIAGLRGLVDRVDPSRHGSWSLLDGATHPDSGRFSAGDVPPAGRDPLE